MLSILHCQCMYYTVGSSEVCCVKYILMLNPAYITNFKQDGQTVCAQNYLLEDCSQLQALLG